MSPEHEKLPTARWAQLPQRVATELDEHPEIVKARAKVEKVHSRINFFIDDFFEKKIDKIKENEKMIVNYKYKAKMKEAQSRLDQIQAKVNEQREQITSQEELANMSKEIERFKENIADLKGKIDQVEGDLGS